MGDPRWGAVQVRNRPVALAAMLVVALVLARTRPATADDPGVQIQVDGEAAAGAAAEVRLVSGRTLLPAATAAQVLGAALDWQSGTSALVLVRDGQSVGLVAGSRVAYVNWQPVLLDVSPQISGGEWLVPLRFVAESLGDSVHWDQALRTVSIRRLAAPAAAATTFSLPDILALFPPGFVPNLASGGFLAADGQAVAPDEAERLWSALLASRAGRALLLLVGIFTASTGLNPLPDITAPPQRSTLPVPDRPGLAADLYRPGATATSPPSILVYAPLAVAGREDPDLVHIADTLARLGFTALVPGRTVAPAISAADIDDVAAAAALLLAQSDQAPRPLTLLCISYGAGPCLAAAARPELRAQVSKVVTLGGYAFLGNLLALARTGRHPTATDLEFQPDPYVQEVMERSLLPLLAADPNLPPVLREPNAAVLAQRLENLSGPVQDWLQALSPAVALRGWSGRLLIIHATGDALIPSVESQLLHAAAAPGQARLAITGLFDHARARTLATPLALLRHAGDLLDLYGIAYEIMGP